MYQNKELQVDDESFFVVVVVFFVILSSSYLPISSDYFIIITNCPYSGYFDSTFVQLIAEEMNCAQVNLFTTIW